jgi:hypothetical protein
VHEWGSPVFDIHLHHGPQPASNITHLDGAGVTVLKAYPRRTFIGHPDAFWPNVSADYHNEAAYPTGSITRGGVTDKWLGDYPNLFGDLSASSGNNAMSRDPEFTADFLKRHQDKLFFGSDCSCADSHGGGVSQGNNPAAARMAGKCVARETLTLLGTLIAIRTSKAQPGTCRFITVFPPGEGEFVRQ